MWQPRQVPPRTSTCLSRMVLKPIDPTVLNNPLPGGSEIVTKADALFVQEAVMAG